MSKSSYLLFNVAIALLGGFLIWYTTHWGIGITPDSVSYLKAVETLLNGEGIFSLNNHWPPGYPTLLTLASLFGQNIIIITKYLHIIIFGLLILLYGAALKPSETSGRLVGIWATLFIAVSWPSLKIHGMAWSEGPFSLVQLATLLATAKYIESNNVKLLFLAGILSATALFLRYAAMPFIGTLTLLIIICSPNNIKERIGTALVFLTITCTPFIIWMTLNAYYNGDLVNRHIAWHPISTHKLLGIAKTLFSFFFAQNKYIGFLLFVTTAILFINFLLRKPWQIKSYEGLLLLAGPAYLVLYSCFIIISISFMDAHTPTDTRIFYPPYVLLFLSIFVMLKRQIDDNIGKNVDKKALTLLASVLLLVITFSAISSLTYVKQSNSAGIGYLNRVTYQMPIWKIIKHYDLPAIYSNSPDLIYLFSRKQAALMPQKYSPSSKLPNKNLDKETKDLIVKLTSKEAVIIYFPFITWRHYLVDINLFAELDSIQNIYEGGDAIVLATTEKKRTTL